MDAVGAQHVGGNPGEELGIVAAVVGYADLDVVIRGVLEYVVGKALCRHPDRVLVHPVGAHSHQAAQAARTEIQILVESVLETGGIAVPEFYHLDPGLRIEIPFKPFPGCLVIVLCHIQYLF